MPVARCLTISGITNGRSPVTAMPMRCRRNSKPMTGLRNRLFLRGTRPGKVRTSLKHWPQRRFPTRHLFLLWGCPGQAPVWLSRCSTVTPRWLAQGKWTSLACWWTPAWRTVVALFPRKLLALSPVSWPMPRAVMLNVCVARWACPLAVWQGWSINCRTISCEPAC